MEYVWLSQPLVFVCALGVPHFQTNPCRRTGVQLSHHAAIWGFSDLHLGRNLCLLDEKLLRTSPGLLWVLQRGYQQWSQGQQNLHKTCPWSPCKAFNTVNRMLEVSWTLEHKQHQRHGDIFRSSMYSCPIPKLTIGNTTAPTLCRLLAAQAGGYPSICWTRPLHQLLRTLRCQRCQSHGLRNQGHTAGKPWLFLGFFWVFANHKWWKRLVKKSDDKRFMWCFLTI